MRVCILTRGDLFPAHHGAAVKIVRTAEGLSRVTGEPVAVVTDNRDGWYRFDDGAVSWVPYAPRWRAAQEWPMVAHGGRWSESAVRRLGYPPEETFLYRPMFDPAWWMRAVSVGRSLGADVFQAEFPGYGVPAAVGATLGHVVRRLRREGGRPRAVVVQHNVEWDRLSAFGHTNPNIRRSELGALRLVDDIIAVSEDDRQRMTLAGVDAEKITVIPHGVDVATFREARGYGIRERYGISPDAPLLFFHGTLHYWPNTEAVRALVEGILPRLLPHFPDLRVLVCGLNPPTYYSHPAVVFAGPVDDLAEHIAAADVCVCPIEAGGGTRMKLLEYMAAGKAIVSTTKGAEGIQYVDGRDIRIADGNDGFADAVRSLVRDPEQRRRLGAAAAAFALRYDWLSIAQAYVAVLSGTGRGEDWNQRLPARELGLHRSSTRALPADERQIAGHLPPSRTRSKPRTLLLLVNRGCNLRCVFCDLWDRPASMSRSDIQAVLQDAREIGTEVLVLTGGEPLLHKELPGIVSDAKALGLSVNITTNGLLVPRYLDALIAAGVDSLSFSLDGLGATHDRLRGQNGAFDKTLRALEMTLARGISASVYFTATRENVGELVDVYHLVRARGARFDFWPVNDAPDHAMTTDEARSAWLSALDTLAALDGDVAAKADYLRSGLRYHDGDSAAVRCLGLIDQYGIKYTGELLPCCVWEGEGLSVGNVLETPLKTLWNAPATQKAREKMFSEGCAVGCFNHSLWEFQAATGLPFHVGPGRRAERGSDPASNGSSKDSV